MVAAPLGVPSLFLIGNFLIGFGGALFGHGTLTATMNRAPPHQAGLALGAWGAVQATAAGLAMALSGTLRDLVNALIGTGEGLSMVWGTASGYHAVYLLEIVLLLVTIVAAAPLIRRRSASAGESNSDLGLGLTVANPAAQAVDSRISPGP
jgi:BCD family chlorophyll transporter-like MFS transporter